MTELKFSSLFVMILFGEFSREEGMCVGFSARDLSLDVLGEHSLGKV
jgi:hypothetical protein